MEDEFASRRARERRRPRPSRLTELVAASIRGLQDRLIREGAFDEGDGGASQGKALRELMRVIGGNLPTVVECGNYLDRVATLQQLAAPAVGEMLTCLAPFRTSAWRARALAAIVSDAISYAVACVEDGRRATIQFALTTDEDSLLLAVAVVGATRTTAPAAATEGLMRAMAMATLLGGGLERGVIGKRMVIGVQFDLNRIELHPGN